PPQRRSRVTSTRRRSTCRRSSRTRASSSALTRRPKTPTGWGWWCWTLKDDGVHLMVKHFNENGLSFRYPANWTLEREDGEHGWTVSLQGPDTGSGVICCDEEMPPLEDVAETVLDAPR